MQERLFTIKLNAKSKGSKSEALQQPSSKHLKLKELEMRQQDSRFKKIYSFKVIPRYLKKKYEF